MSRDKSELAEEYGIRSGKGTRTLSRTIARVRSIISDFEESRD